jgi:uncharacterized protein
MMTAPAPILKMPQHSPEEKQRDLFARLAGYPSLLIAFSGGTDSAYLAWAAHRTLGARARAVTALSPSFAACDRERAAQFAREAGLHHEFIATGEMANPLYVANNPDRCYHCKNELFEQMSRIASARGFAALAYGVNLDDTSDFRPGHRAAHEHAVVAPLLAARLRKIEIRQLARAAGLSLWDRPASACLSSRLPYGTAVTPEALRRVEEGEAILRALGFRQFRVRYYHHLARVEVAPDELPRAVAMDLATVLARPFAALGFAQVELDPRGYRQGSLNETLLAAQLQRE